MNVHWARIHEPDGRRPVWWYQDGPVHCDNCYRVIATAATVKKEIALPMASGSAAESATVTLTGLQGSPSPNEIEQSADSGGPSQWRYIKPEVADIGAVVSLEPGFVNATRKQESGVRRWYVPGRIEAKPSPSPIVLPIIVTCRCGIDNRIGGIDGNSRHRALSSAKADEQSDILFDALLDEAGIPDPPSGWE